MDAHPRTRAPGNYRRRRNESATKKFLHRRSSCLLLQILSVETNSFLPDQQSYGGNFPRQHQTRHPWFHAASHHSGIEILQRTTVGPELALGAKTMWRLNQGHQQGRSNRTDRRNLAQQLGGRMLLAFEQEVVLHFTMQCSQRVDLLVVKLGPAAYARFADLVQPLLAMAG